MPSRTYAPLGQVPPRTNAPPPSGARVHCYCFLHEHQNSPAHSSLFTVGMLECQQLCGQQHPRIWQAFDAIRQDQALASTAIQQEARGQPPKKRVKRDTVHRQQRLQHLLIEYLEGRKDLPATLRGIGTCIRFNI
jgi:hypothetical protein